VGYTAIITDDKIEVHSDMCDVVYEKKDDFNFNNIAHYMDFFMFSDVEEFLKNNAEDKEVIFCEVCKPQTQEYDEEGDDEYVEFDDDEDGYACEL